MTTPRLLQTLILILLLSTRSTSSTASAPPPVIARAIQVHDGDTLRCTTGARVLKVRLWGIDAPELAQPYGTSATLELRRLTGTTTFTLQVRSHDRYGRTVAILILPDGRRVNTILVQSGAAWWYRQYAPKAIELLNAQEEARRDRRGLWRASAPTPPWVYRNQLRTTRTRR